MLQPIIDFIREHWFQVAIILGLAFVARKITMLFIGRLVRKAIRPERFKSKHEEQQREETLSSMLSTTVRVIIWLIAGMMLLSEFNIDIAPLIAGAGIIGVALGFGAQSMVKDFLAGIFIVTENQYRVGDVVQINKEIDGVVERITMRETVLRDLDGMVHHIPNGNIDFATNMTMEYANINLNVGVSYSSDIEKVEKIINEVGESLANDEKWKERIIEPPQFLRVDKFADSAIIVKIMGKTVPMEQWAITGELRKRLKVAFDKNSIEIPFPQMTIHQAKK
jgi:small conductance mechanosensitive channel